MAEGNIGRGTYAAAAQKLGIANNIRVDSGSGLDI
jgi:hypothetical protein